MYHDSTSSLIQLSFGLILAEEEVVQGIIKVTARFKTGAQIIF